jgi:flagellar basal-body rod protein FlgB
VDIVNIFSNTFSVLERGLDYASLNQRTISQNIANVDTPNYKAKKAEFSQVLQDSMNALEATRTDSRHFAFHSQPSSSRISIKQPNEYNHNGNGVDLDREMSDLASNQIYYNAVTDRLSGKFNSLQSVIKGGK